MDFRLKTSYTFLIQICWYTALALSANLDLDEQSYTGNLVPSVPKHNLNLALTYDYSISTSLDFYSKINYQYVSGMYVDDKNSEKTDSYSLLNFLIGFDKKFGRINLLLSGGVNNIFDKRYVGFININSTTGRFYELGEPRNYFVNLNIGYSL